MWGKITQLPLMVYLAITGFFSGLKNDERGLSGLVVTVILILVAVVLVFVFWDWIAGFLDTIFGEIEDAAGF